MEIYLIRHTTPNVAKGICYGQTDLGVTETFAEEASAISPYLPKQGVAVYSSPLQRCKKLAEALFPDQTVSLHPELMELNCGQWEMQEWNAIPKPEIEPWLNDFIHTPVPGGESYWQMHERVIKQFEQISQKIEPTVIVAHGGVLRSIVAYITGTSLKEAFDLFSFHYGCVVKITAPEKVPTHEILYNVSLAGKEWHRPIR
ncbi:MAG: alpha-ribazole phosphatase [Bacteroidota bacterium]|jgi:alpha-ribazole phosphatase